MKIAIIGTGGVGGYFGAKLANAGYDVTFLARGLHYEAIKSNGLKIKSLEGDFHVKDLKVTNKIKDIGISDLLIICTKAWQIREIKYELKEILHKKSIILPLQNGIFAVEEYKGIIEESNILGGLCHINSKIETPGVICHLGATPRIIFGEMDNKLTDRIKEIETIFKKPGIIPKISSDIQADLWKKFIPICTSGLLAISKTTYGEMRESDGLRKMMIDLLKEVYVISQKVGIKISSDFIEKNLNYIDLFPYNATSSLTRDVWEGKPSEIEYQNGAVVKLGKKYGVATPINSFIYNCILPMDIKARDKK